MQRKFGWDLTGIGITLEAVELCTEERSMSFALYGIGYLIVIGGVVYMAHLMHIPQTWIIAIALILLGIGIVTGVTNTKKRDSN